jgi:hypothetical protein
MDKSMVNEALITEIKQRFQRSERREDIKEALIQEGYEEAEVETAISQIVHEALKQLPILAPFYRWMDHLEAKTAHATPKMTVIILGSCLGIVLLLFAGLYFLLDPLGSKVGERDKQRDTDVVKIRNALNKYYTSKYAYPTDLSQLSPDYIQTVPQDPSSGAAYSYHSSDGTNNYELCVMYEAKATKCVGASPDSSSIPVVVGNQEDHAAMPDVTQAIPTEPTSGPTVPSPVVEGGDKAL